MRFRYSHNDIHNAYECLVENACRSVKNKDLENALKHIKTSAMFQYGYNEIFRDDRLENLLKEISRNYLNIHKTTHRKDVVLFYSFVTSDNRGLVQQYLSSLSKYYSQIVYVTEEDSRFCETKDTYLLLEKVCASIYKLKTEENDCLSLIKQFENIIDKHRPSKILLHIAPWSVIPLVTLWAYPNIQKLMINITDHAFGLGVSLIDKLIEFRKYGISLSVYQRKVSSRQICYLPYFPWVNETEKFNGFPIDTSGKIVLFSGGDAYKISGNNDVFFHAVKEILSANPETVFFYAGKGDFNRLKHLIKLFNLSNRFFLIGNRHDIAQVFNHIDIYIGTFPTTGGLMTLYAAYYGKPIISLSTQKEKDVLVGKCEIRFAVDSMEELIVEANKLIRDEQYRIIKGNMTQKALITSEEFANNLYCICEDKGSGLPYEKINIINICVKDRYLELINRDRKGGAERLIVSSLRMRTLFLSPKAFINRLLLLLGDFLRF